MKPVHIIFIATLIGVFFLKSGLAVAWTNQGHYRDSHSSHTYDDRRHSAPYYKNYYSPKHTNQYNRRNEPHHTMAYGWDLIRKGRSHTALDVFSEIANYNPASGGPKLGYAIAAADSGQLSKSVWAMRRVLEADSEFFRHFSIDGRLERKLVRLTRKYRGYSHGLRERDAHFMTASLHYLLGNRRECLEAIERNKKVDDYSPSAMNLHRLAENF